MAAGKCENCGHSPGKALGVQHTTTYYECKKCGKRFCSYCKKTGPKCPHCDSTDVKHIGELGRDY